MGSCDETAAVVAPPAVDPAVVAEEPTVVTDGADSHWEEPAVSEYVPAEHDVQVAVAEEVDPTGPYFPIAHKKPEHVDAPAVAWYLPALQSRQVASLVCPFIPENFSTPTAPILG